MRDLLFLAHRIPYPPNKGDKIRSFHILRHLASRFRIHLGCFADDAQDMMHVEALREFCTDIFCLPLPRTRKLARAMGGLLRGKSVSESCYYDGRMARWVQKTLNKFRISDAFVFCSVMAPYIPDNSGDLRVVTDLVDVDSEKWKAYSEAAVWPLRHLYRYEQRHVLQLERRAVSNCDCALFVSEAEAALFRSLAPDLSTPVCSLENGVDLDYFDPARSYPNPFATDVLPIVFTGMMDYRANVDAVTWFAKEIFPAVRAARPAAAFFVVGARPSTKVIELGKEQGVQVTGAVSDIRPYLAHAVCVVAPMRVARGVQNKVLEAMAMAKPVVVTPAALEGLNALPDRHVFVASAAADFADAVTGVIAGNSAAVGHAARALIEQDYRWPRKLAPLDEVFPP